MRRLTTFLVAIATILSLNGLFFMTPVMAADASKSDACAGLSQLDASQGCGSDASQSAVTKLVSTVVSILSVILGALAIIMIIVSGFRFVTSGGDSNKVAGARSGLIYAVVGLVVAALAQFIVHFVLSKV